MTSVFSPIKQMTAAEFQRVTEVTYLGYVYGALAALKRMLPRDRGVIVQVGARSRIAAFRCKPRIAQPSTQSRVFAIRFGANYSTTTAT